MRLVRRQTPTQSLGGNVIYHVYLLLSYQQYPVMSKPRKHSMPDNNAHVQSDMEERTGIRPCIWQIDSKIK